ncbi:membrane protein [Brucella anthropi]|uniref:YeeE/YedE family protein n=1 Tax=Stappia indica TaxID=538381 RepID=A0A857C9L4_9HYPH|nr:MULTISPECIES: membrane protein [Hyphomicrobiales]EXL08551.1 membrane protein [Brucella anthropi]QGZ35202.1 YeeE/YedE family protein [Stappia indica]WKT93047.1 YeeE/YedE family protein [Brucella anthropi]
MTEFTPVQSLLGGALIGLSAVLLMAFHGRIAGMTGLLAGLLPGIGDRSWRLAFLAGAVAAPFLIVNIPGFGIDFQSATPFPWIVISGLVVGVGVTLGSGCTSGHGICGNARLSPRSIVATLTFMLTTGITVYVIRHLLGGF